MNLDQARATNTRVQKKKHDNSKKEKRYEGYITNAERRARMKEVSKYKRKEPTFKGHLDCDKK